VVFDIANDHLWAKFRDLALQYGLRSCWSTPIRNHSGDVIGTFANYYRVVRDPSPVDQELTNMVIHVAAEAIEAAKAGEDTPVRRGRPARRAEAESGA
jgi:GAF domain-containing protein